MKRFTLRELILYCGLSVAVTVLVGAMKQPHAMNGVLVFFHIIAEPIIDQNAYLLEKDAYYRSLPTQDLQGRRLADQAKLLEAYEKDPVAFVNRYTGVRRTFLFDAVVDGKNMFRVGTFGDGGKWLSDPQSLRPGAVVYSFGISDDISFDVEMAGVFGCEVHAFDPGPSVERSFSKYHPGQAVGKGKFWYHPVGLGPTSTNPEKADDLVIEGRKCPVKRLSEFAAELGHPRVDILKIDIEGGEMPALMEILSSRTLAKLSVRQLLVECHLWNDEQWSSFVHILGLLREQGYLISRKEFNPYDGKCAEFNFLGPE
ncbi:MAG: FkbM family methyltransferase [Planctomycetota bacterium]|nr:FkbM family methyltransferase [Planctomycetota bacterium]